MRIIRDVAGAQDGHLDFHTAPQLWKRFFKSRDGKTPWINRYVPGVQDGHLDFAQLLSSGAVVLEVLL